MTTFISLMNTTSWDGDDIIVGDFTATGDVDLTQATLIGFPVDDVTIEVHTGKLQVKDLGISNTKISSNAISTDKIQDNAVTDDKIVSVAGDKIEDPLLIDNIYEKTASHGVTVHDVLNVDNIKAVTASGELHLVGGDSGRVYVEEGILGTSLLSVKSTASIATVTMTSGGSARILHLGIPDPSSNPYIRTYDWYLDFDSSSLAFWKYVGSSFGPYPHFQIMDTQSIFITSVEANGLISDTLTSNTTDANLTLEGNGTGIVYVDDDLDVNGDITANNLIVTTFTADSIITDSVTAKTNDGDLTLAGNGSGKVVVNDPLDVNGNVTVSDNIIASSSHFIIDASADPMVDQLLEIKASSSINLIAAANGASNEAVTVSPELIVQGDVIVNGSGTGDGIIYAKYLQNDNPSDDLALNATQHIVAVAPSYVYLFTSALKVNTIQANSTNYSLTLQGDGTGIVEVDDDLNVTGSTTSVGLISDSVTSKTTNTNLTLTGNGSGKVVVNDSMDVTGTLTLSNPFAGTNVWNRTTFTATLSVSSGNFTQSTSSGYYTVLNNGIVFMEIRIVWTGRPGSGTLAKILLPITPDSSSGNYYNFTVGYYAGISHGGTLMANGSNSISRILLYQSVPVGGGTATTLNWDNFLTSGELRISGYYFI